MGAGENPCEFKTYLDRRSDDFPKVLKESQKENEKDIVFKPPKLQKKETMT